MQFWPLDQQAAILHRQPLVCRRLYESEWLDNSILAVDEYQPMVKDKSSTNFIYYRIIF
jgi:putative SOS response-associated peptidase YedK